MPTDTTRINMGVGRVVATMPDGTQFELADCAINFGVEIESVDHLSFGRATQRVPIDQRYTLEASGPHGRITFPGEQESSPIGLEEMVRLVRVIRMTPLGGGQ